MTYLVHGPYYDCGVGCPGPVPYFDGTPATPGDIVTFDDGRQIVVEEVEYDRRWSVAPTIIRWRDSNGQGWSTNVRSPRIVRVLSPLFATGEDVAA